MKRRLRTGNRNPEYILRVPHQILYFLHLNYAKDHRAGGEGVLRDNEL